jgi:hypothetical protein
LNSKKKGGEGDMFKKILFISLSLVVFSSLLLDFANSAPATTPSIEKSKLPKSISLGTKPPGGYYYMKAAGLARLIERDTGMRVTVEEFPGAQVYLRHLSKDEIQAAFASAIDLVDAYRGTGPFKDVGKLPIAQLASGYSSALIFATRPDSGITKIEDLAGKKVMYRSPTAATTPRCRAVLEYYGLLDKFVDIERPPSGSATVKALIEKKVDCIGLAAISELQEVARIYGKLVILPLSDECVEWMSKKDPSMVPKIIRAIHYPGYKLDRDVLSSGEPIVLVVNKHLPDDVAYVIVRSLYENYDEFKVVHPNAIEWTLENATTKPVVPFHPGAIRYFKEKGVWTSKQQKWQDEFQSK